MRNVLNTLVYKMQSQLFGSEWNDQGGPTQRTGQFDTWKTNDNSIASKFALLWGTSWLNFGAFEFMDWGIYDWFSPGSLP